MGSKQSKPAEPQRSEEEIMKERWMKLADNKKKEAISTDNRNDRNDNITTTAKTSASVKIEQNNNEFSPSKMTPKATQPIINEQNKIEEKIEITTAMIPDNIEIKAENIISTSEPKPKIDKEHSIIEKVFRISMTPSDKFTYLSLYQAELLSQNSEEAFRLNDLDNIMMAIISSEDKRKNIIKYLLETYHRAVEMIERRYKSEFNEKYQEIRKMTAAYFGMIIYSPENFELKLNKMDTVSELTKYYNETDDEEIEFLITDIISSTNADYSFMREVFSYILNIVHMDNISSKSNFFQCERIKRNLSILTKVLNDNPSTREAFVSEVNFLPKGINGKSFQMGTYLGMYLNLVSFESDPTQVRTSFSSIQPNESENQVRVYSNKMSNLMNDVANLFYLLIEHKPSRETTLTFFYDLINANLERTKMYANPYTTSSMGFLMNCLYVLLKIFFEFDQDNTTHNKKGNDIIFEIISNIDIMYSITTENVNFSKFDRINPSLVKEIITSDTEKQNCKIKEFSLTTKIFFLIHLIISYFMKNLDDEYTKIAQQLSEMFKSNMSNDPKFKELYGVMRAVDIYFRCPDFMKNLMRFNEITCILLFKMNYTKYNFNKLNEVDFNSFFSDILKNLDTSNVINLSLLPNFIAKNILYSSLAIRKFSSESLLVDMEVTKIIIYFAIIYSSQVELIQNPHLRSEIFDILLYFFISDPKERNAKQNAQLLKLLNDQFVKDNLVYSLMRVFIDAERLGTHNQFYEKFSIRHKILHLLENIMKSHKSLYSEKILEFANNYKFECTKMVNLLMNDLTYLIDECIERLMDIKKYQDLKADAARYNALDAETKQLEDSKFQENDSRVKTELKLFNSSMNFMLIICQFCQENFLSLKLCEKLANLMNYSLDVFTSKKNLKLKIHNMTEYGFDPKFILSSIVNIYISFKDYKEFLEYVVQDERSYKIENFERVITLKENGKFSLDYEKFLDFKVLVEELRIVDKEIKAKRINYDDAPEEFLDPITTVLMEDPVILPTSNITVDRTTITTHLLSDPTDPFNRKSLKIEDLVPNAELKDRIAAYKQSKIESSNQDI